MRPDGSFCERPVPKDSSLTLCEKHLTAAFIYCNDKLAAQERPDRISLTDAVSFRAAEERRQDRAVVYYARMGSYIKIGTTVNLRERMEDLRVDCLLVTEPGSYDLERQRHYQFDAERVWRHREMFRESPRLAEHIASLR